MKDHLAGTFPIQAVKADTLLWFTSHDGRIQIILKTNPEGKIFHTVQVERNGFIHSILSGTELKQQGYRYFGERAYTDYISDTIILPAPCISVPDH